MEITLTGQSGLLITAALLGFVLGAVYDIFRVLRVVALRGHIAAFLLDIIYWLICASATFIFILLQNDGKLRALLLIAEVLGASLYYFTIGAIVIKRVEAATETVRRQTRAAAVAISRPVRKYGRAAGHKIAKKGRAVGSLLKKENNLLQIRLKVHSKMMYNLIRPTKKPKTDGK
jgi:spore cortex biosynthesis protein YabQ